MPGRTAEELTIRELTARFNHLDPQLRQVPREVVSGGLVIGTERFEDRLVRTDEGWLFDQRVMTMLQTNAAPDSSQQEVGVVESPR